MDRLVLKQHQWEEMRRQVAAESPIEACGLLAGTHNEVQRVVPVPNSLKSATRYLFDPHAQLAAFDQIEQAGLEILAIYHSHPKGPNHPSPTDIDEAYYDVVYVIWSPVDGDWQARGFWIEGGVFKVVPLEINM
jgi:proteasome lid subunit RPN8/RPN11